MIYGSDIKILFLKELYLIQSMKSRAQKMRLGDLAPNFVSKATGFAEPFDFYTWAGTSWVILFSHPADFSTCSFFRCILVYY